MPFRDLVGHRRPVDLLSRAIARQGLPPSLIFSGPEGVGKRRMAVAVAQALNCTSPRTSAGTTPRGVASEQIVDSRTPGGLIFDSCGICNACKRIARGVHPDVVMISPGESGSIKIEQVRDAIEGTIFRPFEGKRRVTIVDDAHELMPGAQNALLKTLEEPSPSSVFILVTSRPDSLLPTVMSRCSHVRFARLSPADVAAVLERDHEYSRGEALAVAAAAEGSVSRALDMEAGDFSDARADAEELLVTARGKTDARTRVERAKDLTKGGGGPSAPDREYLDSRLQALSSLVRDLGLLAAGADVRWLANVDLQAELEDLSKAFPSERAIQIFGAVDRAQEALERNVSPKVIADWLAMQI